MLTWIGCEKARAGVHRFPPGTGLVNLGGAAGSASPAAVHSMLHREQSHPFAPPDGAGVSFPAAASHKGGRDARKDRTSEDQDHGTCTALTGECAHA